jgi:hypothetical protein
MVKKLMTLQSPTPPSLADVQKEFGLSDDDVDREYGVVEIDPEDHLYSFLVDERKASGLKSVGEGKMEGPYSNPRIAPFGPPEE